MPTTPTARPHVAAVVTALGSTPPLYQGAAPSGTAAPYNVLYADAGTASPATLADGYGDFAEDFQITSVGTTTDQALWAADKARTSLTAAPLTVAGRTCYRVEQIGAQPVRADADLGGTTTFFVAVALYRLRSLPA